MLLSGNTCCLQSQVHTDFSGPLKTKEANEKRFNVTTYPKGIKINGHHINKKLETFRARVTRHRGAGGVEQDFKNKIKKVRGEKEFA
jgi:hypothetical protein